MANSIYFVIAVARLTLAVICVHGC